MIGTTIGTTTRESAILSVHNSVEVVDKKHFAGQSDVFVIQRERPSGDSRKAESKTDKEEGFCQTAVQSCKTALEEALASRT